jgi:hypothetical protein
MFNPVLAAEVDQEPDCAIGDQKSSRHAVPATLCACDEYALTSFVTPQSTSRLFQEFRFVKKIS